MVGVSTALVLYTTDRFGLTLLAAALVALWCLWVVCIRRFRGVSLAILVASCVAAAARMLGGDDRPCKTPWLGPAPVWAATFASSLVFLSCCFHAFQILFSTINSSNGL